MTEELKKWTIDEIAEGYLAMGELNLAIAEEFAALEDEAARVVAEGFDS